VVGAGVVRCGGCYGESFEAANGLPRTRNGLRPYLLDVAYLLCGFEQFGPIWTATAFYPMARVVFGADVLDDQTARVDACWPTTATRRAPFGETAASSTCIHPGTQSQPLAG